MDFAKELMAIADMLTAEEYMSSEEMKGYCADCASRIASGMMKMSRGELRSAIGEYHGVDIPEYGKEDRFVFALASELVRIARTV